jgi:hypothetical protein
MSDWIGPNVYRIECYRDRKLAVATKDNKTVVLKYTNRCFRERNTADLTSSRTNKKDLQDQQNQWTFAHVGPGVSGKEEYLIINRSSGLHLTMAGDFPQSWMPSTL